MRMRITAAIVWLVVMMQPAACQDQGAAPSIAVWSIEIGHPVEHFALCDVDGDARNDALFVTGTRPSFCMVARRLGDGAGFGPPAGIRLPDDCEGVLLQPTSAGAAVLLLARERTTARRFGDFGRVEAGAAAGTAPPFLGFAQDLDGDRIGDPLSPVGEGFRLAFSGSGRTVPVSPPLLRERASGLRGLLSERTRFPLVSLETLAPGAPPRPCFFSNDALLALRGSLESGFGPDVDVLLKVPGARQEAGLERTEARLVDVEGDGTRELLVVRTRTQGAALAQVRTELIFHRLGGPEPGRPAQALLLPGILSSGPDVMDVDRDGRLDLFLSVFGENLTQQVARRLTGRVRLDYLLYRGAPSGPPFQRAPDLTVPDAVPEARFLDWGLRHRLILDEDWSGDGVPDLLRMSVGARTTRIEVLAGGMNGGKAGFTDSPASSAEAPVAVKDHRAWRLGPSEPAVICRTATGAVIFAAR